MAAVATTVPPAGPTVAVVAPHLYDDLFSEGLVGRELFRPSSVGLFLLRTIDPTESSLLNSPLKHHRDGDRFKPITSPHEQPQLNLG